MLLFILFGNRNGSAIDGKQFYRIHEALKRIGISKATWFRWLKEEKVGDVRHKDLRGWRLIKEEDINRIRKYGNMIQILPESPSAELI